MEAHATARVEFRHDFPNLTREFGTVTLSNIDYFPSED